MELYRIQGMVVRKYTNNIGLSCSMAIQIPTFYLDANQLGIVHEEQALKIAERIVRPVDPEYESITPHLHVEKLF